MSGIHPTAMVAPGAQLGAGVEIGAYAVVGAAVQLGDGTRVMPHAFLDGCTRLGAGCVVFPFASIGSQTQDLKYKGGRTGVEIGAGTTLREYVTVNAGTNEGDITRVGARCHLMAYSHIAHQCVLGDEVIISNGTQLAGHVVVEEGAIIGGLCGVHQFVRIGARAFIGGCSKVIQDIPPFFLADGNPAVPRSVNLVGLQRRQVPEEIRQALKTAFRILYRQNLGVRQALDRIRSEVPPGAERDRLLAFVEASERGLAR